MMYALMGQFDKSFAKFREALGIQPDFNYTYMWLSMTYAAREELEESLKWANEYVSRASSAGLKADAHCRRGCLQSWLGRFREALADFDRADKLAEETENWLIQAGALEGKGSVYLARGEFELSRASFEDELKILVGRLRAWLPYNKAYMAWRLGVLALEQGRLDLPKSKESEIQAISPVIEGKDKDRAMVLHDLLQGETLLAQGELDGALAAGQKACGPRSPFWKHGYRYWGFFNESTSYYMDLTARVLAKKGDVAGAILGIRKTVQDSVYLQIGLF